MNTMNPETELEKKIVEDPEFNAGLSWGKPRPGHPEGVVSFHIEEVLSNVDLYSKRDKRESLRLIAIVHDTFKYQVDATKNRSGENHHGYYARKFAEKYITDPKVLQVIELHDEAYNSWQKGFRDNKWDKAEERARKLIKDLGDNRELYELFFHCDNATGDKSSESYEWFIKIK